MTPTLLLLACLSPSALSVDPPATATADSGTPPTDSGTADTADTADTSGTTDTSATTDTEPLAVDEDGDGYTADVDCDDQDPDVHPLAFDACDGVDSDCNNVIDDATDCPCAINHFSDHAYLFCEDRSEWPDARDACGEVGYALVTVNSGDENDWLHETAALLSSREWWSGLNDRDDEGTFTWVSGEPATYTNWNDGEPNDFGRGEDCVPLLNADDREWNDIDCDDDLRFICEAG